MAWDTAREALKIADVALQACEAIEKITGIGGQPVETALAAVSAIIAAVKDGASGKISVADTAAAIKKLTGGEAADDAAADKALHDRFDTSK